MELSTEDKKILDTIQSAFPLTPRPYATLGEQLGMEEAEVFARVQAMKAGGIIRRLGANFQSAKLGFHSTLCAAKVPEEKMADFCARINALPGATHNYLRRHAYNIWFTLIGPSKEDVCRTVAELEQESGLTILNLPATRLYKIRVDFAME